MASCKFQVYNLTPDMNAEAVCEKVWDMLGVRGQFETLPTRDDDDERTPMLSLILPQPVEPKIQNFLYEDRQLILMPEIVQFRRVTINKHWIEKLNDQKLDSFVENGVRIVTEDGIEDGTVTLEGEDIAVSTCVDKIKRAAMNKLFTHSSNLALGETEQDDRHVVDKESADAQPTSHEKDAATNDGDDSRSVSLDDGLAHDDTDCARKSRHNEEHSASGNCEEALTAECPSDPTESSCGRTSASSIENPTPDDTKFAQTPPGTKNKHDDPNDERTGMAMSSDDECRATSNLAVVLSDTGIMYQDPNKTHVMATHHMNRNRPIQSDKGAGAIDPDAVNIPTVKQFSETSKHDDSMAAVEETKRCKDLLENKIDAPSSVQDANYSLDKYVWEFVKYSDPASEWDERFKVLTCENNIERVILIGQPDDITRLSEFHKHTTGQNAIAMEIIEMPSDYCLDALQRLVRARTAAKKVLVMPANDAIHAQLIGDTNDLLKLRQSLDEHFSRSLPVGRAGNSELSGSPSSRNSVGILCSSNTRSAAAAEKSKVAANNSDGHSGSHTTDANGKWTTKHDRDKSSCASLSLNEKPDSGITSTKYVLDEYLWAFINNFDRDSNWNDKFLVSIYENGDAKVELTGGIGNIVKLKTVCESSGLSKGVVKKMVQIPEDGFKSLVDIVSDKKVLVRRTKDSAYCEVIGKLSDINGVISSFEKSPIWRSSANPASEKYDLAKTHRSAHNSASPRDNSFSAPRYENGSRGINQNRMYPEVFEFLTRQSQLSVIILTGDILEQRCDVIVSPSDSAVSLAGGLSKMIALKAGHDLSSNCKWYVKDKGKLRVSNVMDTPSGNMKPAIKRIIHACGPDRRLCSNLDKCSDMLQATFLNCFRHANNNVRAQSIAVPAISSGSFGMPIEVVGRAAFDALMTFDNEMARQTNRCLQHIKFINIDAKTTSCMIRIFSDELHRRSSSPNALTRANPSEPSLEKTEPKLTKALQAVATDWGMTIVDVPRDGDSALNALRDQLAQQRKYSFDVSSLRWQAVDYLKKHPKLIDEDDLRRSYGGNTSAFFRRQSCGDTACDLSMIAALAEVIGAEISVLCADGQSFQYQGSRTVLRRLTIGLDSDRHYVSLHARSDEGVDRARDATAKKDAISQRTSMDTAQQRSTNAGSLHDNSRSQTNKDGTDKDDARSHTSASSDAKHDNSCAICMDDIDQPKTLDCGHLFCTSCIDECFKFQKKCPCCGKIFGELKGNQPAGGKMDTRYEMLDLDGYRGCGRIVISYSIPDGTQQANHPNPGQPYKGAFRTAYLPDNVDGRDICSLLRRAFAAGLIFTVGRSTTSGRENVVTWNDIHHKTKPSGPYGYPDPDYLARVRDELAAKGITSTARTNDNGTLKPNTSRSLDAGSSADPQTSRYNGSSMPQSTQLLLSTMGVPSTSASSSITPTGHRYSSPIKPFHGYPDTSAAARNNGSTISSGAHGSSSYSGYVDSRRHRPSTYPVSSLSGREIEGAAGTSVPFSASSPAVSIGPTYAYVTARTPGLPSVPDLRWRFESLH